MPSSNPTGVRITLPSLDQGNSTYHTQSSHPYNTTQLNKTKRTTQHKTTNKNNNTTQNNKQKNQHITPDSKQSHFER